MELIPTSNFGFHIVRNADDPPPFHLRKPKRRRERTTRPAGRRRDNTGPKR
ncbi:hypothetical protein [Pseudactinotalea sp. Z1748]|uniref:hypothetical protein n=1 Tax=Pseudactinotalea sp. Z1748 TaxID=3413027 RepID=UPI003C7BFAAF